MRSHHQNVERIVTVARQIGDLLPKVVFAGGSATGLLVTDPAFPDLRSTIDVDIIVEVMSLVDYYGLQKSLRGKGFCEAPDQGVICRWKYKEILVDVMPTDKRILGFSNRWYHGAYQNAHSFSIEDLCIKLIRAPYFLGTKLEAFYGRGKSDFMVSHDMEDFIAVLDGRLEIVEDILMSDNKIKRYLADHFKQLLQNDEFLEALPAHLPPDPASQQRVLIIEDRMRTVAKIK
jgi:predicted nucleotidyltransferase